VAARFGPCYKPSVRVAVAILFLGVLASGTASAEPRFWGRLRGGPFDVGFAVAAEPFAELHVWYPAGRTSGARLTIADYVRLSRDLHGPALGATAAALRAALSAAVTGNEAGLAPADSDGLLATPVAAVRDAAAAAGRFPLVLWTHRHGTTVAQHVLSEYLASRGFVVVYAAPTQPPRLPFEITSTAGKRRELDAQVRRLGSVLDRAETLAFVKPGRAGVIAWSYAGESAYALQQSDARVRAVVGISSNVLAGWVYRRDARPRSGRMRVPYVIIDGGSATPPSVMKTAAAPAWFIRIPAMAHGSFNVLEGMLPSIAGIDAVPRWSKAGLTQQHGYEAMVQYVARALEQSLLALPTLDTPFRLWRPEGEPAADVTVIAGGTPPHRPAQPRVRTVTFPSMDGRPVTADFYAGMRRDAPTIVLAHQSQSSRGEYRQIAPRLLRLGFNALAVDTRWGHRDMWNGVANETAARAGTAAVIARNVRAEMRSMQDGSASDIRGAIRWLDAHGAAGPVILWGSSMSANIVLKLAADAPERVAAVLAFSPGEYRPDVPHDIRTAAEKIRVPALIAYGSDEAGISRPIFAALRTGHAVEFHARHGRHGASILLDDPANWEGVETFLARFAR
jgi:dienelactone hydrolase